MRTGVFKAPPRACAIFPQYKRQTQDLQFVWSLFVQEINDGDDVPLLKPVEFLCRLVFCIERLLCNLLCLFVLGRGTDLDTEGGVCYRTNVMSELPLSFCRYPTLTNSLC